MNVRVLMIYGSVLMLATVSVCRADKVLVEENNIKVQYAYPGGDPAKMDRYTWAVPQAGKYKAVLVYEAEKPGAAGLGTPSLAVNVFKIDGNRLVEKTRWLTRRLDSNQQFVQEFTAAAGEKVVICYYTTNAGMPSIPVLVTVKIIAVGRDDTPAVNVAELAAQKRSSITAGNLREQLREAVGKMGVPMPDVPQALITEFIAEHSKDRSYAGTFTYYGAVPMTFRDGRDTRRYFYLIFSGNSGFIIANTQKPEEWQVIGDRCSLEGNQLSRWRNEIIFGKGVTLEAAIAAAEKSVNDFLQKAAASHRSNP
jgi:hypothetical protein